MTPRHYALLLALLCAAFATGCGSTRPNPETAAPSVATAPARTDTVNSKQLTVNNKVPGLTEKGTKPALPARITDALRISTPEGRERRQARRDAAATVPRSIKVKDGAFAWGDYAKATHAAKKATLATDSATLQVATNAVAGRDNTATQTATTQAAPGVGATIAKAIAGPLGWVLGIAAAGAVAYLLYLIWAFIPRRKDTTA